MELPILTSRLASDNGKCGPGRCARSAAPRIVVNIVLVLIVAAATCLLVLAAATVISTRRHEAPARRGLADRRAQGAMRERLLERLGARLRAAREMKGVTVADVADATKIKESLIAGLERGDLADWPDGVFRRAFVKEYARAVGLDPGAIVAEFVWTQSDPVSTAPGVERRSRPRLERPRLALESGRAVWLHDAGVRSLRALADVSIVALATALGATLTEVDAAWVGAAAAAVCYPLSLALFGETAATRAHRWLEARAAGRPFASTGRPATEPSTASRAPTASGSRPGDDGSDRSQAAAGG
jgi:transcriptional regulator with XRE-family HTH domain